MIPLNPENLLQLSLDGVVNGSAYALLGVAFGLIIAVTGRFHFAFVVTYTLAAYVAAEATQEWGLPFWPALVLAAAIAAVLGAAMEWVVYRPLAARGGASALMTIFVASLGLTIVGVNLITLYWIDSDALQVTGFEISGLDVGPASISNLRLTLVATAALIVALTYIVMQRTKLGRMVRAVRIDQNMARVVGIDPGRIFLLVFAFGSFVGGVAAVLQATQTAATPDMGFNPIFYAFTVAFLAGLDASPVRVAAVAVALGLIESLSSFVISLQWTQLVVFVVLFIYVALRPVQVHELRRRLTARAAPAAAEAR